MKWKPEVHYIQLVVKTGFPAAFQSCMIALGGMSVQRLVNSFGSSTMAAYVAANRVDSVAIQVIVSIGTALSVFTGQNIAKNQYDGSGKLSIRHWVSWWEPVFLLPPWYLFSGFS